jgi:hypothetical protein
MIDKPKFELGQVVATPGGIDALKSSGQTARELLARHLGGDWGDLGPQDRWSNDEALTDGSRIFSAYTLSTGVKIWVTTEAVGDDGKRASTCLLLPDEY